MNWRAQTAISPSPVSANDECAARFRPDSSRNEAERILAQSVLSVLHKITNNWK
jgi:hypothetical protein